MYCVNCGNEIKDGKEYCTKCGVKMDSLEQQKDTSIQDNRSYNKKLQRPTGIINIVICAILLLIGIADSNYEYGAIAMITGAVGITVGILQVLYIRENIFGIIRVVGGSILIFVSFFLDWNYDWAYIGMLLGISLLVNGILLLLKKSFKAKPVLNIVFGSLLVLWGIAGGYDWGIISFLSGVAILLEGILGLVDVHKNTTNGNVITETNNSPTEEAPKEKTSLFKKISEIFYTILFIIFIIGMFRSCF